MTSNQITCITAPNLVASSMRITKLTLMIDNSTHYLPYPFTYYPDPIITSIEPAESFVSGGRLILITGQNLDSPQSTKLMVYHEHKPNVINGTSCIPQNSTLITCLTPALSRDMLTSLFNSPFDTQSLEPQQQQNLNQASLSYESGGLKLKMALFMDDVRSVRNLDEYYHHLPHYLTYFDDPQLFRLQTPVVDYTNELYISGENLKMKQLDQDLLITIGSHICTLKSITSNQVVCEPPEKISPLYEDSSRRLVDSPILPIIALVGSNLKYHIGHMQYSSSQYQVMLPSQQLGNQNYQVVGDGARIEQSTSSSGSTSVVVLICLSIIGFIIGFAATFMFALSKFRHSKAEREYKRIQLQMGSLDINGQPFNGNLFDNITIGKSSSLSPAINNHQSGVRSRALDYVGGAFSSKKLFNQLNQHQLPSFPPSPLTDISSLTGSNPSAAALHNQHVVRLSSNGTIINSTAANNHQNYNINSANSNSSQSSPSSTRNYGNANASANNNNNNHLFNNGQSQNSYTHQIQQQKIQQSSNISAAADKSNLLSHQHPPHHQSPVLNSNSRNYSWTQEAPSTIVPYAVIEACNLTLEGKNAIKEYV